MDNGRYKIMVVRGRRGLPKRVEAVRVDGGRQQRVKTWPPTEAGCRAASKWGARHSATVDTSDKASQLGKLLTGVGLPAGAGSPPRVQSGAPTTTTVARARRGQRDTMRHRLRRQARPHLILAGLWLAGAAAHVAALAAGDATLVAAFTVAAAAASAAVVARRRRRTGWGSGRLVAGVLAAAGWLSWVAAAGPSWTATAVLLAGGYAASLRWWRRWRIPDPSDDPAPPPGPDPLYPPRLWAAHNASDGGPLPGTRLTGEATVAAGERYDLHLVPGRQTLGGALQVLPKLRTGLRLRPNQDLILEQHPILDESVLSATIVRSSPVLTADVIWPGRTYDPDRGTIALGPYVDNDGVGEWLVRTANRLHGGFLAGSIGSGKSRMLEGIALGCAEAGCVVWFGDPQGGASSAFLADHVDHVARSVDGIRLMLLQAQRVKGLRQAENALSRWEGWTPEQDRPGLVIIIDECHQAMADPIVQALATELAREGGKLGIVLILASQVATLDAFGKGTGTAQADALRSSVCSGNLLILRSKTRNTRNVLPGVDVDPTTFPRIPGYAYLIDDTNTRRTAPLRGYYLTDEARAEAGERVTWPELDQAAAGAAGDAYRDRRLRAQIDMEALAEWAAALREGRTPPDRPLTRPPAAAPAIAGAPATSGGGAYPQRVIPFPSWRSWQQEHPDPAPATGRRTSVDVVYELVAAGVSSPGEIERRSGYSETAVRNALRALGEAGRVRGGGGRYGGRHGVWTPASDQEVTTGVA